MTARHHRRFHQAPYCAGGYERCAAGETSRWCCAADSPTIKDDSESEIDLDPELLSGRRHALTSREYAAVQHAYDVLNKELFEGKLLRVEFVLLYQPRWAYELDFSYGYFRSQRWTKRKEVFGTIALNGSAMLTEEVIVTTLGHEMVHVWQFASDHPRPGCHNRDWAEKMRSIGLDPETTTGTGEHICLNASDGGDGPFTRACRKPGFKLKWEVCRRCRRNSFLSGSGGVECV
jgi:hypothetical protein